MRSPRRNLLQRTGFLSLLLAVLVVLFIAILAHRAWGAFGRSSQQLAITQNIATETYALLSALKDAETGRRGFLLTGREQYRETYQRAQGEALATLGRLAEATVLRPDQAQRVGALRPLVTERLKEIEQEVGLRRSQGREARRAFFKADRGEAVMDQIRRDGAEIQRVAHCRQTQQSDEARASANLLRVVSTLGGIAILALLFVSAVAIQAGSQRQQQLIQDLQQSFEQTKEARDWLQTTLTSIGDGVIATDATGKITLLNSIAQSLTGWTQEQAVGKPLEEIFIISHEETGAPAENPVSKALREGRIVGLANHTNLTARDGGRIPIDDSAAPICDAAGKISGVVLVFRDITERKRTDNGLRQAERRFRTAIAAISDILWTNNAEGEMEGEQPGWANFTGQTLEQYQGYGWSNSIHPDDAQPTIDEWKRAVAERRKFSFEHRVRRHDGVWRVCCVSALPVLDSAGEIREWVGVHTDETEKRAAEQAVRDAQERLRLALAAADIGTWEFDPATKKVQWDTRSKSIFGQAFDVQLEYDKILLWLHPEDRARVHEITQKALHPTGSGEYKVDYRAVLPNGSTRWIIATGKAFFQGRGESRHAVKFIGTLLDVTEARKAEDQLRSMVDSIDQLAWMANSDGWIFWYNKRWYQYTGTTSDQMEGWGWQSVHDPAVLPEVLEKWNGALRTGHPFDMVFPLKGADGIFRPFLTRVNPVRDPDGTIVRWFGTNTDVEALQRADAALRESAERLRFMSESMPQKIFTAGPNGDVDYLNQQWTEYTGLSFEQIKHCWWTQFLHPDEIESNLRVWKHSIDTGGPFQFMHRFCRSDGVYRWHLSRARAQRDAQGKISMWIGSSTEIHEQRETEEELRRANEDLNQFAFAASHDLQEPLRMISSYSQLLIKGYQGPLDGEAALSVKFITAGTKRMRELLTDLLAYTQVNADKTGDRGKTLLDLDLVLQKALENCKTAIEDSRAVVSSEHLPAINGYEPHFLQLFQNLIGNAIKYRAERAPRVHVSATETNRSVRFAVADNGRGIDPQYHERIFGVFKRLHGNEIPGTGIGLAICKRVVDQYGGQIWVESQLDQGATFYFTLPLVKEATA